MTHTADTIMQVPAFLRAAAPEAMEVVAKTNGATVTEIAEAFHAGHNKVVAEVEKLLRAAATELANRMNEQ